MASDSDKIPEIRYSRDETVAAVCDLIDFASKMYLDKQAYEFPPSTGRPSVTPDSMRFLGKTDVVIDLLRHLPYPFDKDPDRRPQLMPVLSFAPFQLEAYGQSPEILCMMTEGIIWEDVPSHVVGLAMRPRNDHGVLLDTNLGVVFWQDAAAELKWLSPFPTVEFDNDSDDDMSPREKQWRGCDMV